MRRAAKLVHLPFVDRRPAVVFSAVLGARDSHGTPVLSLYQGCLAIVRTVSPAMLLSSFLSELRARALSGATDRVYLKLPVIRAGGAGLLLPPSACRRLVGLERAAERGGIELTAAAALVLDLKTGRPVHDFVTTNGLGAASNESIDAIAVPRNSDGTLPSRADVLFDLAQHAPNLHSVGGQGLSAMGTMVERAELIEWNEASPGGALERLTSRPLSTERAG